MQQVDVDGQTIKFDPKKHKYYKDNEELYSVTQITNIVAKPGLKYWSANQAGKYIENYFEAGKEYVFDETEIKDLAKEASDAHKDRTAVNIGALVHSFAEDYLQAKLNNETEPDLPVNEEAKSAAKQFLDWYSENDIIPHQTERIVYNDERQYAGTLDLLATINDKLTVIDFKTSSGIYPEYWLQVAAYAEALTNERVGAGKSLPEGVGIVRFPKDGADFEAELEYGDDLWWHWEAFQAAETLTTWKKEIV